MMVLDHAEHGCASDIWLLVGPFIEEDAWEWGKATQIVAHLLWHVLDLG